jgi:hypothetical protein
LATPNYSYEKRQRELAKKRKQEEKRRGKLDPKGQPEGDSGAQQDAPVPVAGLSEPPAT